jgi:hypothetical protein
MSHRLVHAPIAAVVALGILSLSLFPSGAGAEEDETPSIKVVMQKLHKGANSPLASLKKSLAEAKPEWKKVQDKSKDFVMLGASLSKNDPPKGDKDSWKKLSDAFYTASKEMDDAAKKEDLKGTKDAYKTVSNSCMGCHKAHKK